MKKALCLFLAMIMALSLVACGGGNQTPPAADAEMSNTEDLNKEATVDATKTYKEKLTIAHLQKHSSLDPQGDALGVTCTMDELVYKYDTEGIPLVNLPEDAPVKVAVRDIIQKIHL